MDFTAIIKAISPLIGTAVAGPLGGAALGFLADKLGVPKEQTDNIVNALQGIDPLKLKELEQDFAKWQIEEQDKVIQSYLADTADARKRDSDIRKAGQHNYRADWIVVMIFAGMVACFYVALQHVGIDEFGKNIILTLLGVLISEWKQITNFEFGSTRGSKDKDITIQTLSKG
jgi:hypothetical protein